MNRWRMPLSQVCYELSIRIVVVASITAVIVIAILARFQWHVIW